VFLEDPLIYKEELNAEEVHARATSWGYEDRFKTRLDEVSRP